MTEYQKMLGGQLYNAQDGELQAMHRTAMELCHALNQLNPNQKEEARALLRQLLGRTGEHFTIKSTFWCDYGRHITIGENFFCNYNCVMLDCAPITFGNNVMVAPNCGFYTAAHPLDHTLRDEELEYAKPITVGDSVWIGGGVTVLPGVTIGSRAVIGGGSVVVHDIPELWPSASLPSHRRCVQKGSAIWRGSADLANMRQQRPAHPPGPSRRGGTGPGHRPGACSPAGRRRASP
ncbi:MAG: maltose acetyltransferase domain-containing protein [Flavonifractor plautii]